MANKRQSDFLPRMDKKPPFSHEVPGPKVAGETRPRRRNIDGLISQPHPSVHTAYDILVYAAEHYGNADCVGTRRTIAVHKETTIVQKTVNGQVTDVKKDWSYFELSPYSFHSFIEFQNLVGYFGAGLKQLGLARGDMIHLYGATSLNWLIMAHGAFTQSCVIATAYDALGLDGLKWSLGQTGSKAIFVDSGLLSKLGKALEDAPKLTTVILNDERDPESQDLEFVKTNFPKIRLVTRAELLELGKTHPAEHDKPSADDLACIMYTSGTSGNPKGVQIKHKGIVAAVAGASSIVGEYLGPGDRLLAYLPQAHIIEFIFENAALFWGATMGFGSPKTLTDKSVRNCKGDIAEFRPSILVGVPAVWEAIRKAVVDKVNSGGSNTQRLFWGALALKKGLLAKGLPGARMLDSLVFNRVRAQTGGRLRICMSGGGPLARQTQEFISMTICPLVSGYGLTETGGMGALNDPRALTFDAHGDIPASVEVKLVDFPDAGYLTSNNPPQGELWIRGAAVNAGYYANEQETKEAFTDDGWFRTGDIAEFDRNGHLKIIDRKKNLVKTLNGEYIALEKLESIYRASPLVNNICVYAAADRSKPVAIIFPAEPALLKFANENGIVGTSLDDIVSSDGLKKLVLADVQRVGREAQLAGFEIIEGVVLDREEWTPENGCVTATGKIQRRKILAKNQGGVDAAYGKR